MNNENSTTQEEPKKSEGKRSRKVSEQASPVKSKDSKKDKDKDKFVLNKHGVFYLLLFYNSIIFVIFFF